mmetsp:Transcript_17863/g.21409  ORF Transcript_17863/g.21409 Transcript_17863/m.21409 type:complete len:84 (+) Transcript_17863:1-252(+)
MDAELEHLEAQLGSMQQKLAACQSENRDLKNELNAFDPAFFDEVEDLKHSHYELTQVCDKYEGLLREYTRDLGVPFTPLTRQR